MARTTMLTVALLGLVASAAAQPTFEPTPSAAPTTASFLDDPSGLPDNSDPASTFVPGLTFTGFIVVPATGEFAGTQDPASATKVLTNAQAPPGSGVGGNAAITSSDGTPFTVFSFTLANPNLGTGVTITLTSVTAGGVTTIQVVALAANQGPTPVGPFADIISLTFEVSAPAGRKLLGQQQGQAVTNQFALSGLITNLAAAAAPTGTPTAPTPAGTPTAPTPAGTPTAPTPAGTPTAPTPAGTPTAPTPAGTPTAPTPAGTPTAPTPAGTPTRTPTAPVSPTRTPTSTSGFPTTCPSSSQYRALGGCKNCVSRSSPFKQMYGNNLCYPPTTLSAQSTVCTNAVHPAFILSNLGARDTIVGCINPFKSKVRLVFPIRNSNYPFVTSQVFIGSSLRLAGVIPRDGFGNGQLVRVRPGVTRLEFTFTQSDTIILRKRSGLTVTVTGVWRRQGQLLDYCFTSYLKVCG